MDIQLGLCAPMEPRMLYISVDDGGSGALWYELNRQTNPYSKMWVTEKALRGYLAGIRVRQVEVTVSGKKTLKEKIEIVMNAGPAGSFTIRAGADTQFARSVALSLMEVADPADFARPMELAVRPGTKSPKTVFASFRFADTGAVLRYEADADIELAHIVTHLQSIIGDGGLHEEESDSAEDGAPPSFRPPAPRDDAPPSDPSKANESQIKEILRCGKLASLAFEPGTPNESITELNAFCEKWSGGDFKTIYDLTVQAAIDFRKAVLNYQEQG